VPEKHDSAQPQPSSIVDVQEVNRIVFIVTTENEAGERQTSRVVALPDDVFHDFQQQTDIYRKQKRKQ
jgi:hypothetical protein